MLWGKKQIRDRRVGTAGVWGTSPVSPRKVRLSLIRRQSEQSRRERRRSRRREHPPPPEEVSWRARDPHEGRPLWLPQGERKLEIGGRGRALQNAGRSPFSVEWRTPEGSG